MQIRSITAASFVGIALLAVVGFRVFMKWSGDSRHVVRTEAPTRSVEPRTFGAAPITFSKHIAPIVFKNCTICHRPNQSAPFNLLSYDQVKKHAKQMVDVTQSRFMPPWLPVDSDGVFENARVLTDDQIALLGQWVKQGAREGDVSDLPSQPEWNDGWALGDPDVVLEMPSAFQLRADGPDVYRNFVIPTMESSVRFVRSAEIRPGNPRAVHHAVLQVDHTRASRALDGRDPEPGFGGIMSIPQAHLPDGHFIGWTPGKLPNPGLENLAWRLEPGDDLVLQLHMRPVGKMEAVRASVGLYFTDHAPVARPYSLVLRSKRIDISPGDPSYEVRSRAVLPVDVHVLSVYPHAHYLGKEIEAWAVLPNQTRKELLRIKQWDFNWQDEYRYREPVFLPKGTTLSLRHTFDNSSGNVRNPNTPPKRVVYGQNSTDEMAELMLQVLPASAADWETLRRDAAERAIRDQIDLIETHLQSAPLDFQAHIQLGLLYQRLREYDPAINHLQRACDLDPGDARARFLLGDLAAEMGRFGEARRYFEEADRLGPDQPETLHSLAQVLARNSEPASPELERAIRLALRASALANDQNPAYLETVAIVYASAGQAAKAIEYSQHAIRAAQAAKEDALADQIRSRLDAYRSKLAPDRLAPAKSSP